MLIRFSKVHSAGDSSIAIGGSVSGNVLTLTVDRGLATGIEEEFAAPEEMSAIWQTVQMLRARIGRASIFSPNAFAALDPEERREEVNAVAKLGKLLYDGLFLGTPLQAFSKHVGGIGSVVVLKCDAISLPWEFLYPFPVVDGTDADCTRFLGHDILFCAKSSTKLQLPDPNAPGLRRADPMNGIPTRPGPVEAGHVFDDALPAMAEASQWYTPHSGKLVVHELQQLPSGRGMPGSQGAIVAFLSRAHDVFHFDCHAEDAARPLGFSNVEIHIRKGYRATKDQIDCWRFVGNPDAIVVLNFCNANSPVLVGIDCVARGLNRRRARSVIASAAEVNDMFALQFSRELYRRLLRPTAIGDALLETRRAMIAVSGNPAALLFGLHGSPLTELDVKPAGIAA